MISFIVIGRNEGNKINKCISSIFDAIKENKITDYEIIYVDSNSTDNSIMNALQYDNIIVFKITGYYNAAIARNIGYLESSGEYLLFMDGDMELFSTFIPVIFDDSFKLKYDFVSGDIINCYYDYNGKYIRNAFYYNNKKLTKDYYTTTTGGIFAIKRNIWLLVNGMTPKYRRSQDLDFGLRLSRKRIFLLRKHELVVRHNTISYFNNTRMLHLLINGDLLYRGILYRDHILNSHMYPILFRSDYTLLILCFIIFFSTITGYFGLFLIYLFSIFGRSFPQSGENIFTGIMKRILFNLVKDIQVLFSILFFFPKKNYQLNYIRIK
ncbi:glycosyltransferase family 2 protein [Candidatus Gottesmanbacteria bacterium]|nr:glycosyltransferase family 2 protein [Candidatus Gottesmanbacteria bacterium]MBM3712101.1 glycosyltransferase family 2 protein [Actinomycetota bacterium]